MHSAAGKLVEAIKSYNREVMADSALPFFMGWLFCVLTYGSVFALIWVVAVLTSGFDFTLALWIALGVTGIYVIVSFWSAWRKVNPFESLDVDLSRSTKQGLEDLVAFGLGVAVVRREALAGAAAVLIGGPASVLEGIARWRDRIRAGDRELQQAIKLLENARKGQAIRHIEDAGAFVLLRRLALIKLQQLPKQEPTVVLTAKGEELISGA